jgi:hypothetical protein
MNFILKKIEQLTSCSKWAFLIFLCFLKVAISAQPANPPTEYPTKIGAYIGIVHPIITLQDGKATFNFDGFYQMGITTAVIIRKHEKYAFNLELVSFVRSQDGQARTNNLMIHPGVTFFLKKNYSITPRLGFESSGRFGPTVIFTKKMFQWGAHPINFNLVNLFRFGNNVKFSYTTAINLTCNF